MFGVSAHLRAAFGPVRHVCDLRDSDRLHGSAGDAGGRSKANPQVRVGNFYPLPDFPIQTVYAIVCGVSDYESNSGYRSLDAAGTDARRTAV